MLADGTSFSRLYNARMRGDFEQKSQSCNAKPYSIIVDPRSQPAAI